MGSTMVDSSSSSSSSEEEKACLFAMQLATASVLPMVLKSAIELDLLELIKKLSGPAAAFVSPAELAAQLPTTNREAHVMLDRILRLLASHSVLNCTTKTLPDGSVERLYGLAPVCKYLTKNEDGVSMAPLLLISQDKIVMEKWYHVNEVVLEGGIPFYKAYGMHAFDHVANDPNFNKVFNKAMSNHSTIIMKKILGTYAGFEGLGTVVDVGGGTGATLKMIISKYPDIKGINFDLPHVIQDAPSYPGVEHVSGDMFASVPKGDAIFVKWICHNWSDEQCLKLLKNCYESITENGKVIVVESILQEEPDNELANQNTVQLDIVMMVHLSFGKERTELEFHTLAKEAGFNQFKKVCCAYNYWIMELGK